jgi:hypothetical protein
MDSVRPSPWRPRAAALEGLAVTALGVLLGVIGPFGSYLNDGPLQRIVYWTANLWAGWLLFRWAMPRAARAAARLGWPAWAWTPPAVAIFSLLPAATSRWLAVRAWPATQQVGLVEWYLQCLFVSALVTALVLWRAGRPGSASTAASADPRDRLPPALGRDVLCLQMEDHYVRLHTERGSALVLMSLSQAVAGLKDVEGLQTHRSWWVARDAVDGLIEDGRNLRLRLKGGLQAPVSRSRVGALRGAGWLDAASPGILRPS